MKKLISIFSLAVVTLAFVSLATVTLATKTQGDFGRTSTGGNNDNNNSRNFNPDKQLSKSACGNSLKNPVINVVQKVQNDADSGEAGNYWAFDYYTRHIKVWVTGENKYCAIVAYDGKFYTVPGQVGPGNRPSGALINTSTNQPVNGNMEGGYRATITGSLLTSPLWTTHGSVGTTNYQCNINAVCPGRVSWTDQYFNTGYGFDQPWWGWKYDGGSHGTWINAASGNSGNIL